MEDIAKDLTYILVVEVVVLDYTAYHLMVPVPEAPEVLVDTVILLAAAEALDLEVQMAVHHTDLVKE
jgi:hypothetical protein